MMMVLHLRKIIEYFSFLEEDLIFDPLNNAIFESTEEDQNAIKSI